MVDFVYENCFTCGKLKKQCDCNKENIPPPPPGLTIPTQQTQDDDSVSSIDELEPLNVRKRRLSIEAESRESFELDRGRLLNDIELKIHGSQEWLNKYNSMIDQLEVENERLIFPNEESRVLSSEIIYYYKKYGVVNVKIYQAQYAKFDKQISEKLEDGTKKVMEKSWFSRGTKLVVTGMRRDDTFQLKKYNIYPKGLQRIW